MWLWRHYRQVWEALVELLSFVCAHWQGGTASGSFVLSAFATFISFRALRQNTVPILSIRERGGDVELVNTGNVATNDIQLELIERERRSSGRLIVAKSLSKGQAELISAFDCPKELHAEFNQHHSFSFEATIRRIRGEEVEVPPEVLARFLLTRNGRQLLILAYGIPDSNERIVRIFKSGQGDDHNFRFWLRNKYSAKFCAWFYRRRYKSYPIYRQPVDFSKIVTSNPEK